MFTLQPAASETLAHLLTRISRVARRRPDVADRLLDRASANAFASGNTAVGVDALYARFGLLEPRGQALQLLPALEQAGALAAAGHFPVQAARVCEALGRIAYQQGEYQLASEQWSRALDLSEVSGHLQTGVAARIGLGQIHYAHADWARGLRQMRDAGEQLAGTDDSYLAAKLALNIGVGSFETGDLPAAERHFSHGLAAARRDGHRVFDPQEAVYGDLSFPLSQDLVNALYNTRNIQQLYSHQTEAINALHEGRNVIISTSTSSGKSLIYQIPVLNALEEDRQTRAMYIFPTKALAQDQRRSLKEMFGYLPGISFGEL
ncbi:MAG: DEAD/DEAH box helicase, partial [Rubrivivax sp.]